MKENLKKKDRPKTKNKMGRPKTVNADRWWSVRVDSETVKALGALAKKWKSGKSEAMRKTVKERAKRMGLV